MINVSSVFVHRKKVEGVQKAQKDCEKVINTQLESSEEQNFSGYSFSNTFFYQLDRQTGYWPFLIKKEEGKTWSHDPFTRKNKEEEAVCIFQTLRV